MAQIWAGHLRPRRTGGQLGIPRRLGASLAVDLIEGLGRAQVVRHDELLCLQTGMRRRDETTG